MHRHVSKHEIIKIFKKTDPTLDLAVDNHMYSMRLNILLPINVSVMGKLVNQNQIQELLTHLMKKFPTGD
jgi:hypothetical protein